MRLERLDLAPYGRFANSSLRLAPDAALHVVLGVNESDKTTTLEAIGDLLFGVRDRTAYAFAYDYKQLRIGGALRLADGSLLEVRRGKGDKNTLLDAEGKPMPEDALRAALGGVDRKTFESDFGLSQRALREGGEALLRAGGSLAETLAAGSASLSALNTARHRLASEADALFTVRKSQGKEFYKALDNTLKLLEPGGIFRLIVPDLAYIGREYIRMLDNGDPEASHYMVSATILGEETRPRGPAAMVYQMLNTSRHLWMWDEFSLRKALEDHGFDRIRRCEFDDCEDPMFRLVESPSRFERAVAMEARRPD